MTLNCTLQTIDNIWCGKRVSSFIAMFHFSSHNSGRQPPWIAQTFHDMFFTLIFIYNKYYIFKFVETAIET